MPVHTCLLVDPCEWSAHLTSFHGLDKEHRLIHISAAYSVAYPWVASLVPRPLTKRAYVQSSVWPSDSSEATLSGDGSIADNSSVVIGIANSLSNLGAFLSSYVFYAYFGPGYRISWAIVLVMTAYASAMVFWLNKMAGKRNAQ